MISQCRQKPVIRVSSHMGDGWRVAGQRRESHRKRATSSFFSRFSASADPVRPPWVSRDSIFRIPRIAFGRDQPSSIYLFSMCRWTLLLFNASHMNCLHARILHCFNCTVYGPLSVRWKRVRGTRALSRLSQSWRLFRVFSSKRRMADLPR